MKKITFLFLLMTGIIWGQTVRVDVSELSNVANVELLANFGGNFAFYQPADEGNGVWAFDMSSSLDATNEYLWRVTFDDTTTLQENLIATVGGQGIDNDVAIGQDFNTDFVNFCNRRVTIGDGDPPATFFNSFRIPGVTYTELTLTAPAPAPGQNYYVFYSVNGFSEFGGPGTVDNGDGTYTAIVRPDAAFEYKWVLNDNPGTVGADNIEDILSCTNDGVTINTDNATFSNRIHAAGEDKMDEFGVCPDTGGGGPVASPFCDTPVTHFGGNADSTINLTIVNTGPNTVTVTAAASDIDFLFIIPPISGNPSITEDTSVPGQITQTLTWAGTPPETIEADNLQWRRTSTGGAVWLLNEPPNNPLTFPFAGTCSGPEGDVTLSDLQVDGVTIDGFSPGTTTYEVGLASATPVPQITLVTTTNSNATVGTITQASAVPGSATFDVTSEDMSVTQTYTVNFVIEGPTMAAPTPPARAPEDVFSIFSDAYSTITTFSYAAGANTYNTDWCPANTELVQIDGNDTNKTSGLGCEGIDFQASRLDLTDFEFLHIDIFTETPTMDASFNFLLSQWSGGGGQDYPLEFSTTNASMPPLPAGEEDMWISLDIPLDSFVNNVSTSLVRDDIVQIVLVSNLGTVWYDNLYFYKGSPLSTNEFDIVNLNVSPNPTRDSWNITSNEVISNARVYDILGKEVININNNSEELVLDASNLNNGIYFARIESVNGSKTLKLVKN